MRPNSLKRPHDSNDEASKYTKRDSEETHLCPCEGIPFANILNTDVWDIIISYFDFWDYTRFRRTCKAAYKRYFIKRLAPCCLGNCSSKHSKRLTPQVLSQLTDLQVLGPIGDDYRFVNCSNLTELKMQGTWQSLNLEKFPKLCTLDLSRSKIDQVVGFESLTNLTEIILPTTRETDQNFVTYLINLKRLTGAISEPVFGKISLLTNLEVLEGDDSLTQAGLNHLTRLTELRWRPNEIEIKTVNVNHLSFLRRQFSTKYCYITRIGSTSFGRTTNWRNKLPQLQLLV